MSNIHEEIKILEGDIKRLEISIREINQWLEVESDELLSIIEDVDLFEDCLFDVTHLHNTRKYLESFLSMYNNDLDKLTTEESEL